MKEAMFRNSLFLALRLDRSNQTSVSGYNHKLFWCVYIPMVLKRVELLTEDAQGK